MWSFIDKGEIKQNKSRLSIQQIQEVRENYGRSVGCKYSMLVVKSESWMKKWYEKRGYKNYGPHDLEDHIWMKKKL